MGCSPPQFLQRLRVGREPGLGPLGGREPEIVEEHLGELLGRVDVDVAPGVGQHLAAQILGLGVELVSDGLQHSAVHAYPDVLHPGQDPNQRHLHLVVEAIQALRRQRLAQGRDQAVDGQDGPSGLLVGLDRVPVEVQATLRGGVRGRVEAGVAAGHVAEVVAGVGRVEQVGGQHRVDQRVAHLHAAVEQRAHEGLAVVNRQRPAAPAGAGPD